MNPRIHNLRKSLIEENLDAMFISSLTNIIYLTGFSDFSIFERDGFLLVTKRNQYIFTHGIYKEAVEKQVRNFVLIDIKRENPINKSIREIVEKEKIKRLGFEAFDLKVQEYERLTKEVTKEILIPTGLINNIRVKKTSDEIKAIKKACLLGDKAYKYLLTKLTPGVSEIELAVDYEFFIKKHGATLSFDSIIAFGTNASQPHHVPTNIKLKQNQFILFDCGVKLNNYCSDMTRTVFFGKATNKDKKAYQAVLTSQQLAINYIRENIKNKKKIIGKNIDAISRNYLIENGYPSMPHSLGHGIGLEVHESPRLTSQSVEVLEEGNVFSIEPGIYYPDNFGIRIEDIFAIENNNLVKITKAPNLFKALPIS